MRIEGRARCSRRATTVGIRAKFVNQVLLWWRSEWIWLRVCSFPANSFKAGVPVPKRQRTDRTPRRFATKLTFRRSARSWSAGQFSAALGSMGSSADPQFQHAIELLFGNLHYRKTGLSDQQHFL